ncbi:MAG TPA: hypothetical protein VH120_21815, partial [Gemmataceae bacterium]|nr:hypothetical protein [Gemmataceae bacterium]
DYHDLVEYRFELAKSLAELGYDFGRALEHAKAATVRERSVLLLDALVAELPDNADYRTTRDIGAWWLGVEQRNAGREREAFQTLGRVPESNRYYADAAWVRTLIRLTAADPKLRDPAEALEVASWGTGLKTSFGLTKKRSDWSLLLALAQHRAGDSAAAKVTLEGINDMSDAYADIVLYIRAVIHWRLGERDRALEYCRAAVKNRASQPRWQLLESFHANALSELGLKESDFATPTEKNAKDK